MLFRILPPRRNGLWALVWAFCLFSTAYAAGLNDTGTLITRYRLYSDVTKEHLYTTDTNEYSVLATRGWVAEGPIYKLYQGAGSLNGVAAVPFYRLYNQISYQHHWTTDANEYNVLGQGDWIREGIDGYILPSSVSGSMPVYRLYLNAFGGLHLWTTDLNEKNTLTTSRGWVDEGVAGYVVPMPPPEGSLNSKQAARLLSQASFGPTLSSVSALTGQTAATWLTEQMAMAPASTYVDEVQSWFDKGSSYHPGNGGSNYTPSWLIHKYWSLVNNAPDQLRHRLVHALMQIFVVSLEDSTLYDTARPFGKYLDNLGKNAFGNFRNLLEDVALSPVMGMYLSHIRNQKADPATGRMPDENFAREVMQLFTIGLYQLNPDGSLKLGINGKPLETYSNEDVVGLARVFTGLSWDMPDGSNASNTFKWGGPGRYDTVGDARFDLKSMRIYPTFHETGAKSFLGTTIAAGTSGPASLAIALDTLFNHPNVGPFIGKQLIQRLVTSNPSPAYVEAVASAFNNNGSGVRGDMSAVIRAIMLHPEARGEPTGEFGKLREPSLRVSQAMRAFGATSLTNRWMMGWNERALLQAPLQSPSVFNYYRPGYVPPNTQIASLGLVAPEFQIADETTVVNWINYVWALVQWGQGWTGAGVDIASTLQNKQDVTLDFALTTTTWGQAVAANDASVVDQIDLLLFSGHMSATLRGQILNAMQNQVSWNSTTRSRDKLRIAAFIALTSAEYMNER
jgi:uncharacterized protein (DUF1800 family)